MRRCLLKCAYLGIGQLTDRFRFVRPVEPHAVNANIECALNIVL